MYYTLSKKWGVKHMKDKIDEIFQANFIRVPKPLIKLFDVDTALFLSELYAEYKYWRDKNQLTSDGYFYSTVENVQNNTGLSRHIQENACKKLEAYGILNKTYRDMPSKRYFRFNFFALSKLENDIKIELEKSSSKSQNQNQSNKETSQQKPVFHGFSF